MGICRNHMHRCHLLVINRYRWSAMWIFAMRMRMRMLVDKFVDLVRSHIDIVANFMKGAFIMPTPQPCIHIMVVGAFPTFTFVIPNILNVGGQDHSISKDRTLSKILVKSSCCCVSCCLLRLRATVVNPYLDFKLV